MLSRILETKNLDDEKTLRKAARALAVEEILSDEIQTLIVEMKNIMRNAPGVGLAAPQIGRSIQLAVIEDTEERMRILAPESRLLRGRVPVDFYAIINPRIITLTGRSNFFFEGCLSIKGRARVVPRNETIIIKYLDEHGKENTLTANGWHARILQHEIDHLNGKLYVDASDPRTEIEMNESNKFKWLNATKDELYKHCVDSCPEDVLKFKN
jgi:peptide deformylase